MKTWFATPDRCSGPGPARKENSKLQTPNSREGPKSKLQTPEKCHIPNFKAGIWNRWSLQAVLAGGLLLVGGSLNCFSQCCPPFFTTQPQSTTNIQGTTATFWAVINGGSSTVNYQWKFNGVNIPGATATNYVIASVQSSNAGSYSVAGTNAAGYTISTNATLTVLTPGTLQFSSANYSVSESVGSALISVLRVGGSYGAA